MFLPYLNQRFQTINNNTYKYFWSYKFQFSIPVLVRNKYPIFQCAVVQTAPFTYVIRGNAASVFHILMQLL
jgi:hypothetical protein